MNKLSLTTFGSTPAALYLADTLNRIGSKPLARQASKRILRATWVVSELENAAAMGALSGAFITSIIEREISEPLEPFTVEGVSKSDLTLVENLTNNVRRGALKSFNRRLAKFNQALKEQSYVLGMLKRKPERRDHPNVVISAVKRGLLKLTIRDDNKIIVDKISCSVGDFDDDITSETLQEKSRKRLVRKNKKTTLYDEVR